MVRAFLFLFFEGGGTDWGQREANGWGKVLIYFDQDAGIIQWEPFRPILGQGPSSLTTFETVTLKTFQFVDGLPWGTSPKSGD